MERVFGSIPDVLKGLGYDRGTADVLAFAVWDRCAGELIGRRTRPLELFENRLVVAVADPTWRTHLEDLAGQLVARLNMALEPGTVKFIEFRVTPTLFEKDPGVDTAPALERAAVPPSLTRAADSIADAGLRESFLQAAAVYLGQK